MGKNIQLLFVFGYPNMVTEHQLKKIRDENFEFKDLLIPSKYSDPSLVMHFLPHLRSQIACIYFGIKRLISDQNRNQNKLAYFI